MSDPLHIRAADFTANWSNQMIQRGAQGAYNYANPGGYSGSGSYAGGGSGAGGWWGFGAILGLFFGAITNASTEAGPIEGGLLGAIAGGLCAFAIGWVIRGFFWVLRSIALAIKGGVKAALNPAAAMADVAGKVASGAIPSVARPRSGGGFISWVIRGGLTGAASGTAIAAMLGEPLANPAARLAVVGAVGGGLFKLAGRAVSALRGGTDTAV